MMKLIASEFRKFKGSYINTVAFAAMLFPVLFTALVYAFTDSFQSEWHYYINSLNLFYGVFLGAFVPSFIAIFTMYSEFKNGTVKNMVASPHSRTQIIVAKTLYVVAFVAGLYLAACVLVLVSGVLIGLKTTFADALDVLRLVGITGMTTVVLVPMMLFLTLVFRNFVVPIVITFLGVVVGIPLINLGSSYFYPWMLPANFFFRLQNPGANFAAPVATFLLLILTFFLLSIVRFRKMDFDA